MEKWKTLQTEYVYKTSFGNLRKDKCLHTNGAIIDSYYVLEYSDWVNAMVITKDKKVVLVEQYRHGAEDVFLEIPAGKIEENETYEEGIVREVREETGYISKKKPIKLGEFMVNPATQNNKVITYLLLDAVKEYEQSLDELEEIETTLVDFEQLGELLRTNKIKTQLFTVNAYFMAKDFLKKGSDPHY